MVLFQLGAGNEWITILYFVFFVIFFFFYPRLMLSQIMWKIERTVQELEYMSDSSKKFLIKRISKKPTKKLKDSVTRFFEFFVITPVSLDPFGVVKKFELVIQNEKQRFQYFVNQVAPNIDPESKANLRMGLAGGIELHTIAKIVRHYVELIKQTKSYQIALLIQMQLPLIERIAKAVFKGTKAMANGEPIGDALGPLVVANLIGNSKTKEIEEDILMANVKIDKRNCFVMKAKGPGGRLGRPGKAVETLVSKNRISRIITIDAAAKLEGEKTGSIAEGVGVAMGGPGVEKSYIEDVAVKNNIPLDSIIVKMKPEEAIMPMRKAIKDAVPGVTEAIRESLKRTKAGSNVIIVGVGNTSGVGNSKSAVKKVNEWVDQHERKIQRMKKRQQKKEGFF
ncbi:MAG: DUF1512 domain-containing protein [Candidatus Aenigmarchaeota archaeon]|nr:DUF1512 domain-containing protein [Candidatus Aenigmarchaeota archaeon]